MVGKANGQARYVYSPHPIAAAYASPPICYAQ